MFFQHVRLAAHFQFHTASALHAMTVRPDIALDDDEQKLFQAISWEASAIAHERFVENAERVAELFKRLSARKAIPKQRIEYFINPEFRTGRVKGSYRDIFYRNGNSDEEIVRHPHFLEFMKYFLCGPSLPASTMAEFRKSANRYGHIGPSDALELGNCARQEARNIGLSGQEAAEEFYKLALDCGIWVSHAQVIRDRVRKLR
jgi:hypothetical protein